MVLILVHGSTINVSLIIETNYLPNIKRPSNNYRAGHGKLKKPFDNTINTLNGPSTRYIKPENFTKYCSLSAKAPNPKNPLYILNLPISTILFVILS